MSKKNNLIGHLFKNPAILYVLSRYGTYIIQFINSLFIAIYLGPYLLGIWGFINLVLDYINQLNFGISHSVNVIVSINKKNEDYIQKVISNGLSMVLGLCFIILFFFAISYMGGFNLSDKYNFNTYVIPVSIIAVLNHFNNLLSNVFRVYGKIFAIALNQSLYPILLILLISLFRGQQLLWVMVIVNLTSVLITLILYILQTPVKLKFSFDFNIIKKIHKKGRYLFLFNSSFALILITSKSFISRNYSVEEFGYFTFSYSLANTILLFINALSYLIFPKMLNRIANGENKDIQNILGFVRTSYISTSHILIHFLILIFPVILILFPDYKQASNVFRVIALTVAIYTHSYGYQTVLIARGKEEKAAIISFIALIFNIILVTLFVNVLKVQSSFVMFATMIVYFFYVLISGIEGRKELGLSFLIIDTIKDVVPLRMFIPFTISIILILSSSPDIYFIIPFILYFLLNLKDLKDIKVIVVKLINYPNFINI